MSKLTETPAPFTPGIMNVLTNSPSGNTPAGVW